MKSQHLFENNIYLISNFTVAHNRIFGNQYACRRFLKKLDHYLSPICQIYQYVIAVDQFHILVKLKDRSTFEKYFQLHSSKKDVDSSVIPFTSYIFSQAMANLQSSAAIHHNRMCNRKGAVFARRYQKHLVECKQELDYWISQLNEMKMQVIQTEKWRYKVRDIRLKMSLADRLNVLRNG